MRQYRHTDVKLHERGLLRRLWRRQLVHYKGRVTLILFLTALTSGLTGLYPIVIQKALDLLSSHQPVYRSPIPVWILLITGAKALTQYGQILALQGLALHIVSALQKKLFSVLTHADIAQIEKEAPAKRASYFTSDIFCVRDLIGRLVNVIGNGVTVFGLVLSMLWMDWSLSLLALILYPIAAWPIQRLGKRVRESAKSVQSHIGLLSEGLTESFEQAKTIRIYQMETVEEKRASFLFRALRAAIFRVVRTKSTIEPFLEILGGVIVSMVLIFTGWRAQMGYGSVGDLTGFVAALLLVAHPLRSLGNLHAVLQEGCGGLERIFATLDQPRNVTSPALSKDKAVRDDTIAFHGVDFSYPSGRPVLQHLNFTVPQGRMVALVGASGAGKSTALSLIPRFYDVSKGSITLGGEDLRSLSLSFLRQKLAYVGQKTSLFDFSIKENIRAGRQSITDQEIEDAAKKADLHDFIMSLPHGYGTRVGYQGSTLSGGQCQRVAIARALAGKSDILLLDEVTSALDSRTEAVIEKTLLSLKNFRTILIVAHRLSTVRKADDIVVLDGGKVSEKGTHEELLRQGGVYARFVNNPDMLSN